VRTTLRELPPLGSELDPIQPAFPESECKIGHVYSWIGMDISSLVPMVEDQPNRYFLESLGKESEILQEQRVRFPNAFDFKDSEIISFFETKMSPTAEMVSWYASAR
jgi:hypothetical protein